MELYIHLCVLLHMDTICRLRLLPFECNWVPELIDDMALLNGRYQLKVLQCLRSANRGRLPALLCALLTADGGSFAVPDDSVCQLLLLVCGLFEKALQTCAFSFPLFRIPATLVGRLARSTSCVISSGFCITAALWFAINSPAAVRLPGGAVGSIWALECQECTACGRVVGVSSSLSKSLGSPLCELRLSCGPVFLSIRDVPEAGRSAPLRLSEIRAAWSRFRSRRVLKRWLMPINVPVAESTALPMNLHLQDTNKVLIAGAFSTCEAVQQWTTASACLGAWITGPKSLNTWTAVQKQAHLQLVDAAKCCLSPVVQKVLDVSAFTQQDVTIAGHWVYALVSPLWGKCYVGACGMEGARCPLLRWMEHMKLAILWNSSTSKRPPSRAHHDAQRCILQWDRCL